MSIEWILETIEEWWARHLLATTITKPDEGEADPVDTIAGWKDPETQETGQIPAARVEMFGHAFVPPRGQRCRALLRKAAGIVWPLGSKRYRPKGLKEGESCLYCTKEGTTVWLKEDGSIEIVPGVGVMVKLGSANPADLDQLALYTQLKADFDSFVDTFNMHGHPAGGLSAGMTSVTGTTGGTSLAANKLSSSVASSNVVAKK